MICRIAQLLVEIPEAGGMAPRCREYLEQTNEPADIVIREEDYSWSIPNTPYDLICYMESGKLFYAWLLRHGGMMLHASAVEYRGNAYLFSGPSGVGKSTHTRLWQQVFGEEVQVFNDDKPALRKIDGKWFAYGTPWCGKDGINKNKKVPLAGICFLKQGTQNRIRRLEPRETAHLFLSQTLSRFCSTEGLDLQLQLVEDLARNIPIYELENKADSACAVLSYETMRKGAEEL